MSGTDSARERVVVGVVLVGVFVVCLFNAVVAVDFTRHLDGPQPGDLEDRYAGFREKLAGVARACYISGDRWRFLNARYALAPTILDPRFVEIDFDTRSIAGFDLDALAGQAAANAPLSVLCDFGNTKALDAWMDRFSVVIEKRDLGLRVIETRDGLALLSVGD